MLNNSQFLEHKIVNFLITFFVKRKYISLSAIVRFFGLRIYNIHALMDNVCDFVSNFQNKKNTAKNITKAVNSGDIFSTKFVLHQFLLHQKIFLYTKIFDILHQFFTPKFSLFLTPKFLIFYTNFLRQNFRFFLHQNFCFFTPKFLLFLHQNFLHDSLKFRKRFFGKQK